MVAGGAMCTCTGGGGGKDHAFGIGVGAGMGAGAGTAAAAGFAASLEFCPWTCSKACPTAITVRLRSLPMMARISSRRGSFARGIAVSRKCYGCFDHARRSFCSSCSYRNRVESCRIRQCMHACALAGTYASCPSSADCTDSSSRSIYRDLHGQIS